jgi:hypothetical protein
MEELYREPAKSSEPRVEHLFRANETVGDTLIGMLDGLTVPFTLAAGYSE